MSGGGGGGKGSVGGIRAINFHFRTVCCAGINYVLVLASIVEISTFGNLPLPFHINWVQLCK